MKKHGKKKFAVILIFCLILASMLLFIGFGVPKIMKQDYTEDRTYEYTATFKRTESGENFYSIYVEEHSCALHVDPTSILDIESFNTLKSGDKIIFRSTFKLDRPDKFKIAINCLALKTEDAEIVTLESSKLANAPAETKIKITASVFAALSFIGAIVCILFLAGVFPVKPKPKS